MKNACTILFGLLLSVCLSLYGTVGMVKADGSAVFLMEICADGVAKTVSIDADGNPVEPSQSCPKCLTCCQALVAVSPRVSATVPSIVLLDMAVDRFCAQTPIINKRNIYPAPRGPPAVQFSIPRVAGQITFDRSVISHKTRSAGRPLFKDATA